MKIFFFLLIHQILSQTLTCKEGEEKRIVFDSNIPSVDCVAKNADYTCPDGCETCDSIHCLTCKGTLELSLDKTKCLDCSNELNFEECGKCSTGKYFDVKERHCVPCMNHCSLCTEATNCFKCQNGKLLTKTGTEASPIYSCETIEHCKIVAENYCSECEEGYFLQNGKCEECYDSHCLSCLENPKYNPSPDENENEQPIENPNICIRCEEGYILSQGECKKAEEIQCKTGDHLNGCSECIDGYWLTEEGCTKCDSRCGICFGAINNCLSCSQNHYFSMKEGNCTTKDDHCLVADQFGCRECENDLENIDYPGYFLKTGSESCTQCAEGCLLCNTIETNCTYCTGDLLLKAKDDNTYTCVDKSEDGTCISSKYGLCTECKKGYWIQPDKNNFIQNCVECDPSCKSCENLEACTECQDDYYWRRNETTKGLCYPKSEIEMTCTFGIDGCDECKVGYWINPNDKTMVNCSSCLESTNGTCNECHYNIETGTIACDNCVDKNFYSKNGECKPCTELDNCLYCERSICQTCKKGYTKDPGLVSCSKTEWGLIIPLVLVIVLILVIILILIIIFIWWKRNQKIKDEAAAIKPFHVSSDLEMILLGADNDNFPLKTDKWELTFGLSKNKAIVDQEYEERVQLANTTKREYYFEFYITPSHKYDIQIFPKNATLKPGNAIEVKIKLKMLCTTKANEILGISAMDVDDQNKETAKFSIVVESDLSMKLDHTELKPIMPPIGEGAFGMVFRGTYRGREVAIKKMKARNLTPEQEKEFNHEVSMMTQLRHLSVVELVGAVYTEGEISIVTEFAEFGSLSKIWKKHQINFTLKVKILDDMAVALAYLHKNNILHRDVKGENLLVFSLNPHSPVCAKLTDFGTCRNISERNLSVKELTTGIGTPTYMAPESLQNSSDYSYPVDVYAFGIVLYETYIERNGYDDDERFNQPWLIPQFVIDGNRLDKPEGIPEGYWELITKCWSQNPEDRPTFIDILNTIETWGEDIRYATNAIGEGFANDTDASSSAASIPSSAQEQSVSESDRASTSEDTKSMDSTKHIEKKQSSSSTSSTTSSSSDD